MIRSVSANHASFKTVRFNPGFNIVLAERTIEATQRDSRNGVGKSTLIEIIHFCLGAGTTKGKGLSVQALHGWAFTLELEINSRTFTVTREVDKPSQLSVDGDFSQMAQATKTKSGQTIFGLREWTPLLGAIFYDLPVATAASYKPTFRSLISYAIRRGKDAYSTPFEHFRKQLEWDKQVNNAFLLGLDWTDAAALQALKDRKKGIEELRKAGKSGVLQGFFGSLGEMEARRVRLLKKSEANAQSLAQFKVHPQYTEIREQTNTLTQDIHRAANENNMAQRMLTLYQATLSEEVGVGTDTVEKMYADAGVALPGVTLRRLQDVQGFHRDILHNRKAFLAAEVGRLRREIQERELVIEAKSNERAAALQVLQTHGALEEYTLLQKRHLDTLAELNTISGSIDNLRACESGLSQLKIDQEVLQQKARRDYDERRAIWESAIALFNSYTERLYNVPGRLVIDVAATGFKFDVEIERSGSSGVGNMKVFCYDMTLAAGWAKKIVSPRLLIHDSLIFHGVDERQRALSIELAAAESAARGFQYICMLNSDEVPASEFSQSFTWQDHVVLTLTDAEQSGSLLGIRF